MTEQAANEVAKKLSPDAQALLARIAKFPDYGPGSVRGARRFNVRDGKNGLGRPTYGTPLYSLSQAGLVACCLDSATLTAAGAEFAAFLCS